MGRSRSRSPVNDHTRPAHRRRGRQPGYLHPPRSRLHRFAAKRLESERLAGPDHEQAARDYVAAGARIAVVKLRHVGCVVATGTDVTFVPARTVHRPVDTTGAGDASCGAFAASDHSATEDQGSVKRLQASWRIGLLRIDRPLRLSWSPGKRLAARGRDANVGCGRLLVSDLNDPLGGGGYVHQCPLAARGWGLPVRTAAGPGLLATGCVVSCRYEGGGGWVIA